MPDADAIRSPNAPEAEADPYANRRGNWFQTFTGRPFFPTDPRAREIFIIDIAHALSNACRFAGHCDTFYSVAQHSLLISLAVAPMAELDHCAAYAGPRSTTLEAAYQVLLSLGLAGLLHDAAEAYIGDMVSPLKSSTEMVGYKQVETVLEHAIRVRFDLNDLPTGSASGWDLVKTADRRMLFTEKRDLRKASRVPPSLAWEDAAKYPPYENVVIRPLPPEEAERQFLDRFHDLWKRKTGQEWIEDP